MPDQTKQSPIHPISRVCVFCGSSMGSKPEYRHVAEELGRALVERGWGLVYGGGSIGLMGAVADAVLQAGGEVIGVIPEMLAIKELLHTGVTQMHVVPNMHVRKALMAESSEAFIALPGGYGTFEELLEVITWSQLGIHGKPIGLLNVSGFYDRLIALFDHAIEEGFIRPEQRRLIVVSDDPRDLLDQIVVHEVPQVRKWLRPDET